jgi:hypothetical protein
MIALSISAVQNHPCPRCGAARGEECRTPSGRVLGGCHTHSARFAACTEDERRAATLKITGRLAPAIVGLLERS